MLAAYRDTGAFAYPGWRLTVPGGPAGGHYKGFTHTQAAGTDLPPQDQYEQDREDGMSSHDLAHASLLNPRGVYRSSGEVPPRPNASGSAATYRGFQTTRHAGTSVAPGSFPADYFETPEDAFLPAAGDIQGMGYAFESGTCPSWGCYGPRNVETLRPAVVTRPGATSVVAQPYATPLPLPPAQSVTVQTVQPISPTPAPIVATNEVIPLHDGSGNYVNLSTGAIVPASSVSQNPATGQLSTSVSSIATGALSWLEQSTLISGIPNWGIAAAAVGAFMLLGRHH
jgi:hypothetical protein